MDDPYLAPRAAPRVRGFKPRRAPVLSPEQRQHCRRLRDLSWLVEAYEHMKAAPVVVTRGRHDRRGRFR